jgi:hypothetical protein
MMYQLEVHMSYPIPNILLAACKEIVGYDHLGGNQKMPKWSGETSHFNKFKNNFTS